QLRAESILGVVTRSKKGCLVVSDGQALAVPAFPAGQIVDTTGAGDLFAAGFLAGLTKEKSLETCARLGALAAAEIIQHLGARLQPDFLRHAGNNGLAISPPPTELSRVAAVDKKRCRQREKPLPLTRSVKRAIKLRETKGRSRAWVRIPATPPLAN